MDKCTYRYEFRIIYDGLEYMYSCPICHQCLSSTQSYKHTSYQRAGLPIQQTLKKEKKIISTCMDGRKLLNKPVDKNPTLYSNFFLKGKFSSGIEGALSSTLNHDFNWKQLSEIILCIFLLMFVWVLFIWVLFIWVLLIWVLLIQKQQKYK